MLTILSGCCSCPGFHLRLGASDCFPWANILLHGPLGISLNLLPAATLPPLQKRDAQHVFLQHRGTHADPFMIREAARIFTNPGTTPITILAMNSDHGLSLPGRKLGPWSEFPFPYRFTVLLNSGGSSSPWSEFWSEFPHFMGGGGSRTVKI